MVPDDLVTLADSIRALRALGETTRADLLTQVLERAKAEPPTQPLPPAVSYVPTEDLLREFARRYPDYVLAFTHGPGGSPGREHVRLHCTPDLITAMGLSAYLCEHTRALSGSNKLALRPGDYSFG